MSEEELEANGGAEMLECCIRFAESRLGAGEVVEEGAAVVVPVERLGQHALGFC